MRKYIGLSAIIIMFAGFVIPAAPSFAEEKKPWLVSVNANYNKWDTDDLENDGGQSLIYSQVVYDKETWGVALTGTSASTSYQSTLSEERFSVTTFTDMAVSTYYASQYRGWKLRGGLDISLPTGKNAFPIDELGRVISDDVNEDLMLLNSYGAGMNLSPHVVATFDKERITWGVGLKYIFSGEYDPTTDAENDNFNPGDRLTVIFGPNISIGEHDFLMLALSYSHFDKDSLGGREIFRNGAKFVFEGRYMKQWSDFFLGTFGLSYLTQQKNEMLGEGNILISETGNSNNNKIEIFFDGAYELINRYTVTGILGYKSVVDNGYSQGDELYDAGRRVIYVEPGVIKFFRDDFYVTAKLRLTRVSDKKDAFSPEDADYSVINLDLGAVFSF